MGTLTLSGYKSCSWYFVPFDTNLYHIMSLIKLAFLLVANVGFHHTFTAPRAAVKAEGKPVRNVWGWFLDLMVVLILPRKVRVVKCH